MSDSIRVRRNRARTSASPGYADHPEDERISLSPLTRTHERLVLWRFFIIIIKGLLRVTKAFEGMIKDRGGFNETAFWKSVNLLIGERTRTRAHSRRHSAAVFYLNNSNPHFPVARERPFKVKRHIFEKMRRDADIRLIVWPRGRRDCYKQPPTCACIHVKYEN